MEVKRTERALRKKLQKIEKDVEHIHQAEDQGVQSATQPFIRQNNRCFSCLRVYDNPNTSKLTTKKDISLQNLSMS